MTNDASTSMGCESSLDRDFCEECSSPLENGFCHSCGTSFSDRASPVGAAPLGRSELSKILGRPVGTRAHGSYVLSMQQGEGMAPLRKEIEVLVEQFNASPEVKTAVRQSAEMAGVKIMKELGPRKAAIASVANEFMMLGRNFLEVSLCISRARPKTGRLRDLVIEIYPTSSKVGVIVNGRERGFKSHGKGLYRKLRIPLFLGDGNATVELENARLTSNGYDGRKVKPLSPSKFVLNVEERSFELFKVLEKARFSGGAVGMEVDPPAIFRKYPISKLPVTERLLMEVGLLQNVSAEYVRLCSAKASNEWGRSPKKMAEEALIEACESIVPTSLRDLMVCKYNLKPSALRSLVMKVELSQWQG